jgi:S1-C subfamily serine protease
MKRPLAWCGISAFAGAVLALAATHWGGPRDPAAPGLAVSSSLEPAQASADDDVLPPVAGQDDPALTPEEKVAISVYDGANRGVVNINTMSAQSNGFFLFDVPSEGAGSGCVLDKEGHILTNYHVIEGTREIEVALFNGQTFPAVVVGQDPANDMAVLQVEAPAQFLHPLPFGDSSRLKVGQRVFAIGNPFGLERTMTTGIISSLNRSIQSPSQRTIKSIIQIDAAINPGNSGGALLDSRGRMIGMNTAIASNTRQSAGVAFAIPVNTIVRIVPQLIEHGHVIRAEIGIVSVYEIEEGLLIAELAPEGPAERAGLLGPKIVRERRRQGPFVYDRISRDVSKADLIVAVDGKAVRQRDDLLEILDQHQPGEAVTITIVRSGEQKSVRVVLGEESP